MARSAGCQGDLPKDTATEGCALARTALPCCRFMEDGVSGVHGVLAAAAVALELLHLIETVHHLRELRRFHNMSSNSHEMVTGTAWLA